MARKAQCSGGTGISYFIRQGIILETKLCETIEVFSEILRLLVKCLLTVWRGTLASHLVVTRRQLRPQSNESIGSVKEDRQCSNLVSLTKQQFVEGVVFNMKNSFCT